jgi:tRNA A-37 threonylcarbamoyl transferase component Bud32
VLNGQSPAALLVQPEGGMRSPHDGKPGSYAELMGDQILVTEVAQVTPKDRANELAGYATVSRPLALGPALEKLAQAGVIGKLELGGKEKAIGVVPADAKLQTMPLASQPGAQLAVVVPPMTGGMAMPIVVAGGAAGGLGLILLVLGLIIGKREQNASAKPPLSGLSKVTELGAAATIAAGTPAPIASSDSNITPSNLGAGAMIGRWEIIKRLGSGGMADVYLAHARGEAGFEKQVAIKVMHPHLARNERSVEHFLDEARLAARISHPNVVQIQDLGKIGNDYVIVMEYVDGVDLERLLYSARVAQRQVPIDVGLGILCRICDGLTAAHRAVAPDGTPLNVIHRDVKAANVLVSKQGGVKVVDFGIAKAATQSHNTVAGETKGTPSMMAPEQRVGDVVDVRADVYSVGAVAYEILTGEGVDLDLARLAHLGVENWPHLPMPSSRRPELPPELDQLLMSAMAFEREQRPADCTVLEAALERIMKQRGLIASDKDIARWMAAELAQLAPASSVGTAPTKPAEQTR